MYELIQVTDNAYYIQCPAKIGLVRTGDAEVCLIDSGNDKRAGQKVRKLLDEQGWTLRAIYNTHSHADHTGGNRYLQSQYGCPVYAPGIEGDFTEHTILEPAYLYGGYPPEPLRHKFLMAQPSEATALTEEALPAGWQMIDLPGHAFEMAGFRTPEDVVYLADCLSSEATLDKYQINFLVDVQSYLDTLETVKQMSARIFIPAHAEPTEEIAPLAQKNIDKVREIAERILDICAEPTEPGQILKQLFDGYGLAMSFEQYVLTGSTIRSYLAWLADQGQVEADFSQNMLLWRRV